MSDKKNNKSTRPLSPHLQIYKPQITSVLSITHRLTGIALFFGAWALSIWVFASVYGYGSCVYSFFNSNIGQAFLVIWTLALYFHLLNGVRHLFWDIGKGYEIKALTISGYFVLLGSVTLTIITWFAKYYI